MLTHISGESEINTVPSFSGKKIIGRGSTKTQHEHYTEFKIDGVAYRCWGNYSFNDGDEVVLYALPTDKGYYYVANLKNLTRNFFTTELSKMSWKTTLFVGIISAPILHFFLLFVFALIIVVAEMFVKLPQAVQFVLYWCPYVLPGLCAFGVLVESIKEFKYDREVVKLNNEMQAFVK